MMKINATHTCVHVDKQYTGVILPNCKYHYYTLEETENCKDTFYQLDILDIVSI